MPNGLPGMRGIEGIRPDLEDETQLPIGDAISLTSQRLPHLREDYIANEVNIIKTSAPDLPESSIPDAMEMAMFNQPEEARDGYKDDSNVAGVEAGIQAMKEKGQEAGPGIISTILMALGAGISGTGAKGVIEGMKAIESQQERQRKRSKTADMEDPESAISKQMQDQYAGILPGVDLSKMSAAQIKEQTPLLFKQAEMAAKKEERGIKREVAATKEETRAAERAETRTWRQEQAEQRTAERQETKGYRRSEDERRRIEKEQRESDRRVEKQAMLDEKKAARAGKGVEALDRDYAKQFNEWTTTGIGEVDKSLGNLEEVLADLETKTGWQVEGTAISGGILGAMPNIFRTKESILIQQKVQESALAGIRAAMGAQFTEAEGTRILGMAYDPTLEIEENITKIKDTIETIKKRSMLQESKARHWEDQGTLGGWKSPLKIQSGSVGDDTNTIRVKDPSGKIGTIPRNRLDAAKAAGYVEI